MKTGTTNPGGNIRPQAYTLSEFTEIAMLTTLHAQFAAAAAPLADGSEESLTKLRGVADIINALTAGRSHGANGLNALACWGIEIMMIPADGPAALALRVNGRKFAGWLSIRLDEGADLYNIFADGELVREGIFFDNLTEVCDDVVEDPAADDYAEFANAELARLLTGCR